MIYQIEFECPYCGKTHVLPVEVADPVVKEVEVVDRESEEHGPD